MCRIAGRLGGPGVSLGGAGGEIPALAHRVSNARRFDWGGRLPNSNGGARRSPHPGWESGRECKGTRGPDCEADMPGRRESGS